jgi:hypothetical protein
VEEEGGHLVVCRQDTRLESQTWWWLMVLYSHFMAGAARLFASAAEGLPSLALSDREPGERSWKCSPGFGK